MVNVCKLCLYHYVVCYFVSDYLIAFAEKWRINDVKKF
jgi:hypothetical protein